MERNTQQKTFTAIAKQFRKKLEKGELSGIFVLLESTMYMYIDIIESWFTNKVCDGIISNSCETEVLDTLHCCLSLSLGFTWKHYSMSSSIILV